MAELDVSQLFDGGIGCAFLPQRYRQRVAIWVAGRVAIWVAGRPGLAAAEFRPSRDCTPFQ